MKHLCLSFLALLSFTANSQNTYPTTGNVGIGTLTPSAKLDVNGRAIIDSTLTVKDSVRFKSKLTVDDKVVFKQNAIVKGNLLRVENNARVQNNFRVDGLTKLNGNVKMPNISMVNNVSNPSLELLSKNENGQVKTMTKAQLIDMLYDNYDCLVDPNGKVISYYLAKRK
jgi:hypothetical protein